MHMTTYIIRNTVQAFLDSPQNLDFHIRNDDYFSFLATIMGFIEEGLGTCTDVEHADKLKSQARELRHDLRYIQANYHILPRPPEDIQVVPGRGNLLTK